MVVISSQFVWALRSSVSVVFNNYLLIDATDRSKISSYQKRFFIALSLYPLSFFAKTPFKHTSGCESKDQLLISILHYMDQALILKIRAYIGNRNQVFKIKVPPSVLSNNLNLHFSDIHF